MQDILADFPDFDLLGSGGQSEMESLRADPFRPAGQTDWENQFWYQQWKILSAREYHGKIPVTTE